MSRNDSYSAEQVQQLVAHLRNILFLPSAKKEDFPEVLQGIEGAEELHEQLWALRLLVLALSSGDLSFSTKAKGIVVGALKGLQGNLRHLTWQTRSIAAGQYEHKVQFLGEFSVAFNHMVDQLRTTMDELHALTDKYKMLSLHDPLTGVYNRAAFEESAVRILSSDPCRECESSLIMCDVDFFKRVNDTFGHLGGDEVLRCFSQLIGKGLRPQDLFARYGGEEFIILLPGIDRHTGKNIAERLRQLVEDQVIVWQEENIRITASFGIAPILFGKRGDEKMDNDRLLDRAISIADDCLYQAKRTGRNRVVSAEELDVSDASR